MRLPWQKQKAAEASTESAQSTGAKAKIGNLRELLKESVPQTAVDMFRENTPFVIERNGETAYVGLLLDTDNDVIGGISKKDKKKTDKSQIVEMLLGNTISNYSPGVLLDENKIVIIPTEETLVNMEQFGILFSSPYEVCVVTGDGSIYPQGINITLEDARGILTDVLDINDFVSDDFKDEEYESDDTDEDRTVSGMGYDTERDSEPLEEYDEEDENVTDRSPDPAQYGYTDERQDNTREYEDDSDEYDEYEDTENTPGLPFESQIEESYSDPEANLDTYIDENYGDDEYDDDDIAIDADSVDQTITRRFFGDELGLEVSTEAFDAQFLDKNPYIPFDENRPQGWLNDGLNEISKQANVEILRLHQHNLFDKRENYLKLLSLVAKNITEEMSISDYGRKYGKLSHDIYQDKENKENDIQEVVNRKKIQLNEQWNEKVQEAGRAAAVIAEQQYKDRYGREHDNDLFNLESLVRADIDADYETLMRDLNANRRQEAKTLLDLGITEVLNEISESYRDNIQEERRLMDSWSQKISQYINANIKDEKLRIEVLRDQQQRDATIEKLTAERTRTIEAIQSEFKIKRDMLEDELVKVKKDNATLIAKKEQEFEVKYRGLEENSKKLEERIDELITKIGELDARKSKEYESQLQSMGSELSEWKDKYELSEQRAIVRSRRVAGFGVLVALLLAIAVFAIGYIQGSNAKYRQIKDAVADPTASIEYRIPDGIV